MFQLSHEIMDRRDYVKNPSHAKYLTHAEELALWKRVRKGDQRARDSIISSYTRFVLAVVTTRWRMVPLEDRYSAGLLGLLKAIETFDYRKGAFPPHAKLYIQNELREEAYLIWSIVRLKKTAPKTTRNHVLTLHLWKTSKGIMNDHLTADQIKKAAKFFALPEKIVEALDARTTHHVLSLNEPAMGRDQTGQTFQDLLVDGAPSPDAGIEAFENKDLLRAAIEYSLDNRERYIIQTLHLTGQHTSLRDCGNALGISYERVRQIQLRAMRKIKEYLAKNGLKNL